MFDHTITVRAIGPAESGTLELLAHLSESSRPMVGERDGVPLAAIAMTSGTVLTDPENTPLGVIRALRHTRYRIMRQGGQGGAARSLLSRRGRGFALSFTRPEVVA